MPGTLTARPSPRWDEGNADRHRQKHTKCFERLLRRKVTLSDYKHRSQAAIDHSWAEFEATWWDQHKREYEPRAAYYLDDDLVQAVTTIDREVFKTCLHQHLQRPRECEALIASVPGDRRVRYLRHFGHLERGRIFIDVRRIRGV